MTTGRATLRTERLVLRRPTPEDAAFALELLSDPATTTHNPSDALSDPAAAGELLTPWRAQWDAGLGYRIVEEPEGVAIGVCGVKAVDLPSGPAWNLLYRFLPRAWGRGIAREAASAAVREASEVDPLRPVIARVRPANTASARVAAAIGLVRHPELDLVGDDGPDEVWATPPAARTP